MSAPDLKITWHAVERYTERILEASPSVAAQWAGNVMALMRSELQTAKLIKHTDRAMTYRAKGGTWFIVKDNSILTVYRGDAENIYENSSDLI